MASSKAATVDAYLRELPEDRRKIISAVRKVIVRNLPRGFEEVMDWGVISYHIPLSRYPATYNKKPLMYAGLAAQKNYCAVYLMGLYQGCEMLLEFRDAYKRAGKKLDMGNAACGSKRSTIFRWISSAKSSHRRRRTSNHHVRSSAESHSAATAGFV